jgi:hypothetical protein
MSVEQLLRLKGVLKASAGIELQEGAREGGSGLVAAYPRIRAEVIAAVGAKHTAEFERLFPSDLKTTGRPWGTQAEEVKLYFAQMAGWIDGMIESAILDQRIQAEAEAKMKRVGFE